MESKQRRGITEFSLSLESGQVSLFLFCLTDENFVSLRDVAIVVVALCSAVMSISIPIYNTEKGATRWVEKVKK